MPNLAPKTLERLKNFVQSPQYKSLAPQTQQRLLAATGYTQELTPKDPRADYGSKFIPQLTKGLYENLPFGKRVIGAMPNAADLETNLKHTPSPRTTAASAGRLIGDLLPGAAVGELAGAALVGGVRGALRLRKAGKLAKEAAQAKRITDTVEAAGGAIKKKEDELGQAIDQYINSSKGYQTADAAKFETILGELPKPVQEQITNIPGVLRDANGKVFPTLKNLRTISKEAKELLNPEAAYNYNKTQLPSVDKVRAFRGKISELMGETDPAIKPLNQAYRTFEDNAYDLTQKMYNKRGGELVNPIRRLLKVGDEEVLKRMQALGKDVPEVTPMLNTLQADAVAKARAKFVQGLGGAAARWAIPTAVTIGAYRATRQ